MKTAIVTGASKGIGRATAQLLIDAGHRVINISRTPSPVSGVQNHLIDLTALDVPVALDQLVDDLLESAEQSGRQAKAEKVEMVLVHNAARLVSDTVISTDAESLRSMMEVNVIAPQLLNHRLLPHMAAGSSIIYIGSTLSEKAVANAYSYVVTKHALIGMMRATCQDLAGRQIHTACICPGFTDTEMLRTHLGNNQEVLDSIASASTFGRLVAPEEIARCIVFAASNPAVNGTVIHANLGQIES